MEQEIVLFDEDPNPEYYMDDSPTDEEIEQKEAE